MGAEDGGSACVRRFALKHRISLRYSFVTASLQLRHAYTVTLTSYSTKDKVLRLNRWM